MNKTKLRDIIIVIPGITGSVLVKDKKTVWEASYNTILKSIANPRLFDVLRLDHDDLNVDDIDGIHPESIAKDFHLLPGICRIDGYSKIPEVIYTVFDNIVQGDLAVSRPANYYEFPYDWRRDNRYNARKLGELIEKALASWKQHTALKDSRVILIGHSMGGLISRYYLEALNGWSNCKALITFATPHRGSVDALDAIVNGAHKLHIDMTMVMRTFTSIYQLLPIYKMVWDGTEYRRVNELDIPFLEKDKATAGIKFHHEIMEAVEENRKIKENRYGIIPVVGTFQRTLQSASIVDGKLSVMTSPPSEDRYRGLEGGDGTVPLLSAIPIELSDEYRESYVADKHASLQNNVSMLSGIAERLRSMQANDLKNIRGSIANPPGAKAPALSLEVDSIYFNSEGIISGGISNVANEPDVLVAKLRSKSDNKVTDIKLERSSGYKAQLPSLASGAYHVELTSPGNVNAHPVNDVFIVSNP